MSLLRIYKTPSHESPDFNRSLNKITFKIRQDGANDYIDMASSYIQLHINPPTSTLNPDAPNLPDGERPVHAWTFGAKDPVVDGSNTYQSGQLFYDTTAIIRNVRFSSQNQSQLEFVRDVNFLRENLNVFELTDSMKESLSTFGAYISKDLEGHAQSAFNWDLEHSGDIWSDVDGGNIMIPLRKILALGSNRNLPLKALGDCEIRLELENMTDIISEYLPTRGFTVACANFTGEAGALNQIVLGSKFNQFSDIPYREGDWIVVLEESNGVDHIHTTQIDAIAYNDTLKVVALQFTHEIFNDGQVYTNVAVIHDITTCENLAAGNELITNLEFLPINADFPYWVGQLILVRYRDGAGAYQETLRHITELSMDVDAMARVTITVDGDAFVGDEEIVVIHAVPDEDAKDWTVDNAELVLYRKQSPDSPSQNMYRTYEAEVINQEATHNYTRKFDIDPNSDRVLFLHKNSKDLLSREPNAHDYRMILDNVPLTDRNVDINSPLYKDRLARFFGTSLSNLHNRDSNVVYPELLIVDDPQNQHQLQFDVNSNGDNQISASNLHCYKNVEKQFKM